MFYSPRNLLRRILGLRLTLSRLASRKHGDFQSSKLDECFLRGQTNLCPFSEKAAIFQWSSSEDLKIQQQKQHFSACLMNAVDSDFTNLVGSVKQGYARIPAIEDTLATHLSPSSASSSSASSWNSHGLLPSKPCRTTSALVRKSYMAAARQVWPFMPWPFFFRPTKWMSLRKWTRVGVWHRRWSRSSTELPHQHPHKHVDLK